MFLETKRIQCPYCWESVEIVIDPSVGEQSYIEDCFVCCRPIELQVNIDHEGDIWVQAEAMDGNG
jgi:hypothetical protein